MLRRGTRQTGSSDAGTRRHSAGGSFTTPYSGRVRAPVPIVAVRAPVWCQSWPLSGHSCHRSPAEKPRLTPTNISYDLTHVPGDEKARYPDTPRTAPRLGGWNVERLLA